MIVIIPLDVTLCLLIVRPEKSPYACYLPGRTTSHSTSCLHAHINERILCLNVYLLFLDTFREIANKATVQPKVRPILHICASCHFE